MFLTWSSPESLGVQTRKESDAEVTSRVESSRHPALLEGVNVIKLGDTTIIFDGNILARPSLPTAHFCPSVSGLNTVEIECCSSITVPSRIATKKYPKLA